jgi:hypothetical protein
MPHCVRLFISDTLEKQLKEGFVLLMVSEVSVSHSKEGVVQQRSLHHCSQEAESWEPNITFKDTPSDDLLPPDRPYFLKFSPPSKTAPSARD